LFSNVYVDELKSKKQLQHSIMVRHDTGLRHCLRACRSSHDAESAGSDEHGQQGKFFHILIQNHCYSMLYPSM
jgi:hypothetical protein